MATMFKGQPTGFSVEKSFNDSFAGALPINDDQYNGKSVEYYNPMFRVDKRAAIKDVMFNKIDTQTGGAGTAGTALIPVMLMV